jgi:hypothetical protein
MFYFCCACSLYKYILLKNLLYFNLQTEHYACKDKNEIKGSLYCKNFPKTVDRHIKNEIDTMCSVCGDVIIPKPTQNIFLILTTTHTRIVSI